MHIHNNAIVRLNRETHPRTRVVEAFPDGSSAPMLVYAEFRHVAFITLMNRQKSPRVWVIARRKKDAKA